MTGIDIDRVHERKPRPGSVYGRAVRWFADNPGEFLTYADLQAMLDLTDNQLHDLLRDLRKHGVIETAPVAWKAPGFKA